MRIRPRLVPQQTTAERQPSLQPSSTVRVLRSPEELRAAVAQALEYENRAARQSSERISFYENLRRTYGQPAGSTARAAHPAGRRGDAEVLLSLMSDLERVD